MTGTSAPVGVFCGHCRTRHASVKLVKACSEFYTRDERGMAEDAAAEDRHDRRPGGRWADEY